ncbi:bifunctional precorrin-2 dehydrogenase/sirohydrochlorin ferrochelatase [Proteinivorax tanatarense]|uniref:precorrin-2 dehydrogenase n=1 Tax=Proteinivorax tanatarense TaxID=1260629 RepID=A0AAU7VK90_9FIRM
MNNNLSIFLDITGKKVLVVGGGKVAWRKVSALLDKGCEIKVVSPKLISNFDSLIKNGKVTFYKRKFNNKDLLDNNIVFAATDDVNLNKNIFLEGEKHNVLVNNVTSYKDSTFIMPANHQQEFISISVSTHGKNPFLSKYLKNILAKSFSEKSEKLAEILNKYRVKSINEPCSQCKRQFWEIAEKNLPSSLCEIENLSDQHFKYLNEILLKEYNKIFQRGSKHDKNH